MSLGNVNAPNTENAATVTKVVSNQYVGGVNVGQSATDYIGFYGKTPAQQQAVGSVVATTVAVSTTSAIWGFSTSTQANAVITAVAAIQTALKNLGISS